VLDSAAKHTMACRVDEEMMHVFASSDNILNNKHKYCVNRHELVLNTGNNWKSPVAMSTPSSAYPLVVSNLGDIKADVKTLIMALYAALKTPRDLSLTGDYLKNLKSEDKEVRNQMTTLPFCHVQGYSLGVAYANHRQGDIICAVQVGGMISVRNGHFPCNTGDMVQWYFEWEKDMFQPHDTNLDNQAGSRVKVDGLKSAMSMNTILSEIETILKRSQNGSDAPKQVNARQKYAARDLGMNNPKANVPYPKPYVVHKTHGEHYGDQIRVFAKCINGGRAHDMIDIMLMTQSL